MPEDIVKDVRSGVYSSDSRPRSQIVVGKRRAASISKNAGAGRKPLTAVAFQPVRGSKRALMPQDPAADPRQTR